MSSFLYVNYLKMIYKNRIEKRDLRKELAIKIAAANQLAYGTKATHLTFDEYQEITQITWFPKLQKHADNISFLYTYDGFLPDYSFSLSFDLPSSARLDSTAFKHGDVRIDFIGNKKRIQYNEFQD